MNFALAIQVVLTVVATTLVACVVLTYAARCFHTVVQDTAAGNDEATWPDEPWKDAIRAAVYPIALLLIWLAPAGIAARALRRDFLPDDGALRFVLIAGPFLWLFFPIGLLSALSSASQWAPLRLTILRQLLRILPSLLLFYILTALVGAVGVVPWFYALFRQAGYWLPLAGAVGAAALLIYARLLGRLGWLLVQLKPLRVKKAARPSRRAPVMRDRKAIHRAVRARDPWAAPKGELTLPSTTPPSVEGYEMAREEPKKRKKRKKPPVAAETEPKPLPVDGYDFSSQSPPEDNTLAQEAARLGQTTSDLERRLFEPQNPPYVPPYPLLSRVFTFPWYASTMRQWIYIAVGSMALGACVKALIALLTQVENS